MSKAYPKVIRRVTCVLRRRIRQSDAGQYSFNLLAAMLIGAAAGLGAAAFRWLIAQCHWFYFDKLGEVLSFMGDKYVIVVPALGGLVVGLIIHFGAREAKGHGVPEVLAAVAAKGGRIRGRVALVKTFASAVCIGSGGSTGREGPIVQIGASIGSATGQLLKVPLARRRMLVACGAAAGIAATFNAPLAGVLFAQEIILGELTMTSLGPLVMSAVTSATVGYHFFGNIPAFAIPEYSLGSLVELPWFLLLGVLAALAGVLFIRVIYIVEDWVEGLELPVYITATAGGLVMGGIGFFLPQLFGTGYETMEAVLTGLGPGMIMLFLLTIMKIIATSITLGSGGSGGIMAPALFTGAMLGTGFGYLVSAGSVTTPPAYGLVGMAAVFAASAHAPITAILTVFEMTRDYHMIVPLMLTCGMSTVLAKLIYKFSIYNLKLNQAHIHYSLGSDTHLLNDITIGEAMTSDVMTVLPQMPVRELAQLFEHSKHHGFPIADENGRLHGIVALSDIRDALTSGHYNATVADIGTHDIIVAFPEETLNDALRKLGLRDIGRLPVVDPDDHTRLIGLITRKNIISAYNRVLMHHHTHLDKTIKPEHIE